MPSVSEHHVPGNFCHLLPRCCLLAGVTGYLELPPAPHTAHSPLVHTISVIKKYKCCPICAGHVVVCWMLCSPQRGKLADEQTKLPA